MNEHEYEPVPGLPQHLPRGETLLWQGAPSWQALARRAYHTRAVALYFAALMLWELWSFAASGWRSQAALQAAFLSVGMAAAAIGLLMTLAWLMARSTRYTITSRRVVIRSGIALPATVNLPFTAIDAADLRLHADGTGDLPLTLGRGHRVSWLMMWPHVRPGKLSRPQPMLRSVAQPEQVASILSRALSAQASQSVPVRVNQAAAAAASPLPA